MSVNSTTKPAPPANAAEAERRFFAKYGGSAGSTWAAVQGFLSTQAPKPTSIEGWIAVAEQVRDQIADLAYAEDQLFPDKTQAAPAANNDMALVAAALVRLANAQERIAGALEKMAEQPAPAARSVAASAKPEIRFGSDGIPICPKHDRRMKESQFGGWFCTAKDDEGKNGRCGIKVKE